MSIFIQRDGFHPDRGFEYHVSFKPNLPEIESEEEVRYHVPVEASLSVSETGELADFSFTLPKPCRSEQALTFIRRQSGARITPPQVFVPVPGPAADAVATAVADLELDVAGRIIGMAIRWMPDLPS